MSAAAIVPIRESLPDYSARQLTLIKRTIAPDCNDDEFNLFIEVARRVGLDPFRRQILPLVFSKDKPERRRMSILTAIDGFRVIAARCADYRPDENEADITYDGNAKSSTNPLGIVKAKVTVWKQDGAGIWHPVNGTAYWDEFVPIKEDAEGGYTWEETGEVWEDSGKPKKRKVPKGAVTKVPDGNWGKMPRVMLPKCAEAQALRKGWPAQMSGLYEPAEMDRARIEDVLASELIAQEAERRRVEAISGESSLIVDWMDDKDLARVPLGQFADRAMAFIRAHQEEPSVVFQFRERNRVTLQDFWARAPGDALELKKAFEGVQRAVADHFAEAAE